MKTTTKSIIFLLIALTLILGVSLHASAEEPLPEAVSPDAATLEAAAAAHASLGEDARAYVTLAATVSCYREQFQDPLRANEDIEHFLTEINQVSLERYEEMRTQYSVQPGVASALLLEQTFCSSRVLAHPEDAVVETPTPQKDSFSYRNRMYSGGVNTDGLRNGKLTWRVQKNGKEAHGTFKGEFSGQRFAVQIDGQRKREEIRMSSKGGKDSLTCDVTLDEKKASGKCSGKVKGRQMNFTFSATNT